MRLTVMTPKRLRLAALVLFILALFFAWLGFQSQPQSSQVNAPTASAQPKAAQYTVWKATQDIQPGQKITQDAVEAVSVSQVSTNQIQDLGAVLPLRVKRPIIAGTIVSQDMLEAARPIADELPLGYRALAVNANEVLTVGGHLQPGDKVDVIYLLRPNAESGSITTVRRLASNIEILAVGSQVSDLNPEQAASLDLKSSKQDKQQTSKARSVVLAVEEKLAPTILLAESSGDLRLSMVGHDEMLQSEMAKAAVNQKDNLVLEPNGEPATPEEAAQALKSDNYLAKLEQFKTEPQAKKTTAKTKTTSAPLGHYIEVIQGDKRTWVNSSK